MEFVRERDYKRFACERRDCGEYGIDAPILESENSLTATCSPARWTRRGPRASWRSCGQRRSRSGRDYATSNEQPMALRTLRRRMNHGS